MRQLIPYNKRNIFLKSFTNCGGETVIRSFSKKTKLSLSIDQESKFFIQFMLFYVKLRAIEIS